MDEETRDGSAAPADIQLRPLTRREYDRPVDLGHFEDEPLELLDGMLVEMSPEGEPHSGLAQGLNWLLARGLADDVRIRIVPPLGGQRRPRTRTRRRDRAARHWRAHPDEALLLIEVTRSSLAKDLGIKARIYAAGVAVRMADLLPPEA